MTNTDDRRKGWPPTLHVLWMIPAAAALLAMAAPQPPAVGGLQQANENPVRVQAECTGDGKLGRVSVDPWTLVVTIPEAGNPDEDVVWLLENGPAAGLQDADSIQIRPKEEGEWPFGLTRVGTGGRSPNARAVLRMFNYVPDRGRRGRPRDVEIGDKFWYNVIVFCTDADTVYTVSIDPDIEGGGP